jgi:predicted ribosomally synthesized peptide with nif11-like leader
MHDLSSQVPCFFEIETWYVRKLQNKEFDEMLSHSAQAFNKKIATSPEFQTKLHNISSPIDFLALAQAEGFDLDLPDLQTLAQEAFQDWLKQLPSKTREFFYTVRNDKTLDSQLKTCQSPAEAIALATQCGFQLSEDDLKQAASAAESIDGFSFEKLWFRGLGLLG